MTKPRGAEESRDVYYYRLTYRDETGESAVHNVIGRTVTLTWENGLRIHVNVNDIRPFLDTLEYRQSRRGLIWGSTPTKKDGPVSAATERGQNQNPTSH